jgi:hypothetical protein
MRKTLILFVLKLIAASAILYAIWDWKGQMWYALLFRQTAIPAYGLLGIELVSLSEALNIVVSRFFNILPFLSLMSAAWGISWRRRMIGALAGFLTLLIWHLAFTLIVSSIIGAHQLDPTAYRLLSPWFLLSDALPFVLWVIIAYKPLTALLPVKPKTAAPGTTHDEQ